jgi:aryl-alcohol dehydrogenase-like predicted oxidoreductase
MQKRKLRDLEVNNRLWCNGFCMGYGATQKEETIKKLIRKTYTFFDTAEIYAVRCQRAIGCGGLKSVRNNVVIATKFLFQRLGGNATRLLKLRGRLNSLPFILSTQE